MVLSLIFLKFVSDKFEAHQEVLKERGQEKYLEMEAAYAKDNVFYLPETSRWSYVKANAKQDDIALKIDTALKQVEKTNKSLQGALPDNYFSRLDLDRADLASLVDKISEIDTLQDAELDIIGRVYEYFLGKFAIAEGKGKGEFYTPKSIVNLIAELIEPYKGKIYDPCCGSGGMFVQCLKFIQEHQGNTRDVSVYGQEKTTTTYKLAKMNLAIRGISGDLGARATDTFSSDQHPDLKADFIMANPPFNQKDWRGADELTDDARWDGFNTPPASNANYGWILHMASKLSANGVAGFILSNGALSGDGEEKAVRKQLLENGLVEAIIMLPRNMFYSTDISVTLWILNNNKEKRSINIGDVERQYRDRAKEVLFMDLRQVGEPFEKKFTQFNSQHIQELSETFHNWQNQDWKESYKNIPEFCYSANLEEIQKKDYSLVPSKYIEFVNRDENINFDEKMTSLKSEFKELLEAEGKSKSDLLNVFKELGYEIEL